MNQDKAFVPPTEANTDAWEFLRNKGWNWAMLHKYPTKAYTPQQ